MIGFISSLLYYLTPQIFIVLPILFYSTNIIITLLFSSSNIVMTILLYSTKRTRLFAFALKKLACYVLIFLFSRRTLRIF